VQFTAATIDQIAAASGGIPRVINLVCDRALVAAARARTTTVDVNHIGWAIDDLKLPAQTWRAPSREHLGPHVESSDKDFAKASTAREHQHQLPPQGEGLVPTADSVDNGPGDLPLDTARSPAAFSSTVLDIEIAQARASDVREVAAAQLVFEEGVKAARRRRPTQWALVGAGLVLLTGLSGYWYSRAPASRQPSGVLAQPAQPQLPVQAPPERPVNPLPTAKSQVAGSPSPTPVQTETKVAAPGAPANAVSPAREGERAASEKSRNGQTGAKFVLQMATFQTPARAEQALQEFSDAGYVAYSREVSLKDGAPAFTVFLGPYADLALAEQDLARARQIPGYVSARVVPVGASVRLPRRPQP
jgi:cell division septation protein DedD